jgi:hypothetical protein
MVFLRFPHQTPACSVMDSPTKAPLAPCGWGFSQSISESMIYHVNPYSTEQDTQPIVFQISKQAVPYRTRGSTCFPVVSTPKIWFLADSRKHMP